MTSRSFSPVSDKRWQDIKSAISQQAGIAINSDSGQGVSHGIEFSWSYANDSLSISVISVPWYLPVNEQNVMSKFSAWISGVQ